MTKYLTPKELIEKALAAGWEIEDLDLTDWVEPNGETCRGHYLSARFDPEVQREHEERRRKAHEFSEWWTKKILRREDK